MKLWYWNTVSSSVSERIRQSCILGITSCAFFCFAVSCTRQTTSMGLSVDNTTGQPGLMMPAFCAAISVSVFPSRAIWSKDTEVIAQTSGFFTTFVASSKPPMPVSRTTRSQCCSRNQSSAMAKVISNCEQSAETGQAFTCSQNRQSASPGISCPSIWMRSV